MGGVGTNDLCDVACLNDCHTFTVISSATVCLPRMLCFICDLQHDKICWEFVGFSIT